MNAIAESINRLTIALNALRESVDRCDVSRRLPAKVPEPLKSIAEEMCSDVDMCDFDTAIVIMDRISSQCRRKVRLIDKMASEIQKSSRPNASDDCAELRGPVNRVVGRDPLTKE